MIKKKLPRLLILSLFLVILLLGLQVVAQQLEDDHNVTISGSNDDYRLRFALQDQISILSSSWENIAHSDANVLVADNQILAASFDDFGVWLYDGSWNNITTAPAQALALNNQTLAASFNDYGIWFYDGEWSQLTPATASALAIDNGKLVASVENYGIWIYDGGWTNISAVTANEIAYSNGVLVASFKDFGVWLYDGEWSRVTPTVAQAIAYNGENIIISVDQMGLWSYNTAWVELTAYSAQAISAYGNHLIASFDNLGIWFYDNSQWVKISSTPAQTLALTDQILAISNEGVWLYDGSACTVSNPDKPSGGTTYGVPNKSYTFSTGGASCTAGHSIQYRFDWGDGKTSSWGSLSQSKKWNKTGTYLVKAQARCAVNTSQVSSWSSGKEIVIRKQYHAYFNNDKYSDISLLYDYGNQTGRIHVFTSTGSGFTGSTDGWRQFDKYDLNRVVHAIPGDFNGNGLSDIALVYDYGNSETRIHVFTSTGSGFNYSGNTGWWSRPAGSYNAQKVIHAVPGGSANIKPPDPKPVIVSPVANRKATSGFIPNRYLSPSSSLPNGWRDAHLAYDYISSTGNLNISAFAAGKVVTRAIDSSGGYYLILEHNINGKRVYSLYLHLAANSWRVKVGDQVTAGQVIATMGETGVATGVHLHFAISDKKSFPVLSPLNNYTQNQWVSVDYIVHPQDNARYYNPERVIQTSGSIIK